MLNSRFRSVILALVLATGLISCQSLVIPGSVVEAFVIYPLEKIRPRSVPSPGSTVTIRAAGNEFAALLFGISNSTGAELLIRSLSVQAEIPAVDFELFGVQYYRAAEPSHWFDSAAAAGWWPDPLIPVGQALDGKLDFEFTQGLPVPAGENRHFLLDLHLPAGYRTIQTIQASLTLGDGRVFHFSFRLEPFNFDLPAQPAVATSANFNPEAVAEQHGLIPGSPAAADLVLEYRHQMARHFLAPYSFTGENLPVPGEYQSNSNIEFDFAQFDATIGRFLDGEIFPDAPAPSSFWVPDPGVDSPRSDADQEYWRQLQAHLRNKGWLDRSIKFLRDEPLIQDYHAIRLAGERFKSAAPEIPVMVTEAWSPRLAPVVDLFCPDIFNLGDALGWYPFFFRNNYPIAEWQVNPDPAVYRKLERAGRINWLYSCNSGQLLDIPNVFIDSPAAYQRAIAWLMFRYGFQGFLYWHVNFNFMHQGNPWQDQFNTHSHGDGNLFYPGRPGQFWLTKQQPVPSLRLKLLREGFQDFAYLRLYQAKFGEEAAWLFAARGARTSLNWERKADRLGSLRLELGRRIESP